MKKPVDANREAKLRREIWELCCAAADELPLEAIYGALATEMHLFEMQLDLALCDALRKKPEGKQKN